MMQEICKENPGALAGATGADSSQNQASFGYVNRAVVATLEAAEAGDASACEMAMRGLARLTILQRMTVAACGLGSLPDDAVEHVVTELVKHAGLPRWDPVFPMHNARHWAGMANRIERKAMVAACFEAMDQADRDAFLRRYAEGVAA